MGLSTLEVGTWTFLYEYYRKKCLKLYSGIWYNIGIFSSNLSPPKANRCKIDCMHSTNNTQNLPMRSWKQLPHQLLPLQQPWKWGAQWRPYIFDNNVNGKYTGHIRKIPPCPPIAGNGTINFWQQSCLNLTNLSTKFLFTILSLMQALASTWLLQRKLSSFPSSRYVSFQVDRFWMWWYSNGAVRKACHGIFGPR